MATHSKILQPQPSFLHSLCSMSNLVHICKVCWTQLEWKNHSSWGDKWKWQFDKSSWFLFRHFARRKGTKIRLLVRSVCFSLRKFHFQCVSFYNMFRSFHKWCNATRGKRADTFVAACAKPCFKTPRGSEHLLIFLTSFMNSPITVLKCV